MARLLHTSDTHLGYRQYHLDERRQDFADVFTEVISAAIDHDVDAVVHAGDLFHTSRPGITPLQTALTELQRLQRANIPFLLIVGNHERTHDRNWVELLEEVGLATRLDAEGTQIADTTVYGLDYVPPGQRDRLDYQFAPYSTDSAILVSHGLFTPFGHADWDSKRILAKSPIAFDLMLVGDDHTPRHAFVGRSTIETDDVDGQTTSQTDTATEDSETTFSDQQQTPISYAGSTERTKADQRQPRSYSLVTIPEDADIDPDEHINRHEIQSAREFVYVDVELKRGEGLDSVKQAINERVDSLDGSVLKVTLLPAEEDPPTPDLTSDGTGTAEEDEVEPAVHERVPEGPIENQGAELGALTTRVSDRRDLIEDSREYQAVEFADIDAAVQERRRDKTVSGPADKLLEMALDTERFNDTGMADSAEETVTELLEDTSPAEFHVDNDVDGSKPDTAASDQEHVPDVEEDDKDTNDNDGSPADAVSELID